jgi:SAM-dependent methyltransferase
LSLPTGSSNYWQDIYHAEPRPGWDLGGPTPLLPELLELAERTELPLGPSLAVPGCGFGHDAAELARRGFRVTGVDFAPAALQGARERYGDLVRWAREDWFAGTRTFDGIFDHTCFAAMDPPRREAYLSACARRVRPGGAWLAACFDRVVRNDGPPFAVSMDEVRVLAEPWFDLLHLGRAERSHPRRAGREFLVVAKRRQTSGDFAWPSPCPPDALWAAASATEPVLFPYECE